MKSLASPRGFEPLLTAVKGDTTLGLVENATVIEESEEPTVHTDVANGGVNPDDTALGMASNWDSVMDDVKDLAGVRIETLSAHKKPCSRQGFGIMNLDRI